MPLTPRRLSRLARHRERLERLQEERLAEARQLQLRRRGALDEARSSREQALDCGAGEGPLDLTGLAGVSFYLVRAGREIDARTAALRHSDATVEAERARLLERRRDVRAIETLLERRLAEQRLEQSRAAIERLDEQAARRWFDRE
jgi:flagellar export protein FliJ